MSQPAKLRIILQDHDIRRLELPSGIPDTVDELHSLVQQTFQIEGHFTLHFKDADFGDYFSLTSVCDVKDKDTLKVVHVFEPPMVTLTLTNLDSSCPSGTESATYPHSDSCSSGSQDTLILSSPEHMTHCSQRWPVEFPIPRFTYNTELVLASGNEAFEKDGILLSPTAILPDVLEKLAETIFQQDVVNLAPPVDAFKECWPALFDSIQICEEFKRITTINLESSFMAKLDQYCPKLMELVSSRGGAAKMKINQIKGTTLEDHTIERRREVAIRCMVVYLGEKEEDLSKEYVDGEDMSKALAGEVMKIMVNKAARTSDPASATIVIEATEVLSGLDLARACALLMGLFYALNLSYPRQLRHTFEVFQKLLLELDELKASPKVMSLKQKLLS
ncbi:hypothetical protein MHYP_G00274420 [Metynnis hypsauchen]